MYTTGWNGQIDAVNSVHANYNMLYPFAAARSGAEGAVSWAAHYSIPSNIVAARAAGRRIVMSTGGAGQGINFHSRYVSQNFVTSIVAINTSFGGTLASPRIDGVDFNTFEAEAVPNVTEYLWMFGELKRLFGSNFIISSPPAPWKDQDKEMIRQALAKNLMDYAGPQYYDGPGLEQPDYIVNSVRDWVNNVAGGDASKITVGFGFSPGSANYSSQAQIQSTWDRIEAEFPSIRGAFLWQHQTDKTSGWPIGVNVVPDWKALG